MRHAQFTMPASRLHAVAEWVARVVPGRPAVPVLGGLVLDAADDQLSVSAFDYEVRATATVDAHVTSPGRLLVPAPFLVAVAKAAGGRSDITLDASRGLHLQSGKTRWSGPRLPIEDYPNLPALGDPLGDVDADEFFRAAKQVLPAVAATSELGMEMLAGVQLTTDGDTLTLAATDRWRLAAASIPWKPATDDQPPTSILIPKDALVVATRSGSAGTLTLTEGANHSQFGISTPGRITTCRQIDKDFVKWKHLLPTPGDLWATLSATDLRQAITQISPAFERLPQLHLDIGGDAVQVSAAGATEHDATTEVAASTSGEIRICANERYLRDALDAIDTDQVTFYFSTPTRPILVLGDDPNSYQHLLMPVRSPSGESTP